MNKYQIRSMVAVLMLAGAAGCGEPSGGATAGPKAGISVLSSDPARVTGGDALVDIRLSDGVAPAEVTVQLDGTDVGAQFSVDLATGHLRGLLLGLAEGENTLAVMRGETPLAREVLRNFPLSGPVFSGPHQSPFVCQTESFKLPDGSSLGPPIDADCNAPVDVQYLYKSNRDGTLKPYKAGDPRPADLSQTTTSDGHIVDYFVRLETGVINRAVYQIAFLHSPGTPLPAPGRPSPGWNGALIYAFGGGCGPAYRQGTATAGVIDNGEIGNDALDLGYAQASSTLNVLGQNCNDVTSAETAVMVKEHFIEHYGVPRYTLGVGGSGGSMQQHLLAQNYPGILDGLLPGRSFPDTITITTGAADCPLLNHFFANASKPWTDDQKTAVSGFASYAVCANAWVHYLPRLISPLGSGCDKAIPSSLLYDPHSNPSGARCSYYDNAVNVYGRDPDTGATRRPLDNVGVQYGLSAFQAGKISADQFISLNEHIGGYDPDGRIVDERMVADPQALQIAYRTGRVDQGTRLDEVAIIDVRSYVDRNSPADVHTRFYSFSTRERLMAANGSADNQVIWVAPSIGSLREDMRTADSPLRRMMRQALAAMDEWLSAVTGDESEMPLARKIVMRKPAGLADACFTEDMQKITEPAAYSRAGRCNELYPSYGDPRTAAGAPIALDTLKCAVKPVDERDYAQPLTPQQLVRLRVLFPDGVCDYSKPGIGRVETGSAWQSYAARE